MKRALTGLAAGAALWLAAAPAGAMPGMTGGFAGAGPAQPAAMCGYSCRSGGRYIPGPPGVCADEGLRYCGSSRDAGPRYRDPRRERDDDYYDRRPRERFYR